MGLKVCMIIFCVTASLLTDTVLCQTRYRLKNSDKNNNNYNGKNNDYNQGKKERIRPNFNNYYNNNNNRGYGGGGGYNNNYNKGGYNNNNYNKGGYNNNNYNKGGYNNDNYKGGYNNNNYNKGGYNNDNYKGGYNNRGGFESGGQRSPGYGYGDLERRDGEETKDEFSLFDSNGNEWEKCDADDDGEDCMQEEEYPEITTTTPKPTMTTIKPKPVAKQAVDLEELNKVIAQIGNILKKDTITTTPKPTTTTTTPKPTTTTTTPKSTTTTTPPKPTTTTTTENPAPQMAVDVQELNKLFGSITKKTKKPKKPKSTSTTTTTIKYDTPENQDDDYFNPENQSTYPASDLGGDFQIQDNSLGQSNNEQQYLKDGPSMAAVPLDGYDSSSYGQPNPPMDNSYMPNNDYSEQNSLGFGGNSDVGYNQNKAFKSDTEIDYERIKEFVERGDKEYPGSGGYYLNIASSRGLRNRTFVQNLVTIIGPRIIGIILLVLNRNRI